MGRSQVLDSVERLHWSAMRHWLVARLCVPSCVHVWVIPVFVLHKALDCWSFLRVRMYVCTHLFQHYCFLFMRCLCSIWSCSNFSVVCVGVGWDYPLHLPLSLCGVLQCHSWAIHTAACTLLLLSPRRSTFQLLSYKHSLSLWSATHTHTHFSLKRSCVHMLQVCRAEW